MMTAPQFNKITFPNGLRVVLVPQRESAAATILVLVEAGSKYEVKEMNGLSHFLEHMCFKGTERRPRAIDIASALDGVGALSNAFTGFEYSGYFAKVAPRHFDTALDVVSDIYLNQIFDPKEIDKERGVVIEEINMYEDLPMRRVQELFVELLYGDQPAGRPILGSREVVQRISRDDCVNYRTAHYLAQSTIVVVAGNFDESAVIEKIEHAFSSIKNTEKSGKVKTRESQGAPQILMRRKQSDQTHLVVGVRAFDVFDERRHALEVLAEILGGGMSSRLFQRVREEMGAAYYINAETDLLSDHGFLSVSAGIDHQKIDAVIDAILAELRRAARETVAYEELEKAKEHLVGTFLLGLETSDALAGFYGGQEVVKREIVAPEAFVKHIREVTPEEIMRVAGDIFKNEALNCAIIGPFDDAGRFEKALSL